MDLLYMNRRELEWYASYDVFQQCSLGPPEYNEVSAIFLALCSYTDRDKGRNLVQESAAAVARAGGEAPSTEFEIDLVAQSLHVLGNSAK